MQELLHQRQLQNQQDWRQHFSEQELQQQEECHQREENNQEEERFQQAKIEPNEHDEEQEYKNEFTISEIKKSNEVLKRTRTFFIKK